LSWSHVEFVIRKYPELQKLPYEAVSIGLHEEISQLSLVHCVFHYLQLGHLLQFRAKQKRPR